MLIHWASHARLDINLMILKPLNLCLQSLMKDNYIFFNLSLTKMAFNGIYCIFAGKLHLITVRVSSANRRIHILLSNIEVRIQTKSTKFCFFQSELLL